MSNPPAARVAPLSLALQVLLLFLAVAASAQEVSRELDCRWDLVQGMEVRGRIAIGPAALVVAVDAPAFDAFPAEPSPADAPPARVRLCFGAPALLVGQVADTGLLRQVSDPLGFSPGSEVFTEQSGLRPDRSLDGRENASIALEVVPGMLLAFGRAFPSGLIEEGVVARLGSGGPASLEAAATLSLPLPAAAGDTWIVSRPPWPGGWTGHLASRAAVRAAPRGVAVSASLALAASSGRHCPPGGFLAAAASIAAPAVAADVMLAAASRDYRGPDGTTLSSAARGGLTLKGRGAAGSIEASYLCTVGSPPPARGPFLPTTEETSLALERQWRPGRTAALSVRLAAERRLECGADGADTTLTAASFAVAFEMAAVKVAGRARAGGEDGGSLDLECRAGPVSLAGSVSGLGMGATAGLEVRLKTSRLEAAVAVAGLPRAPELRLQLSWSASSGSSR